MLAVRLRPFRRRRKITIGYLNDGFLNDSAPAGAGGRQEINGIPFYFLPLGGLSSSTTPIFPAIDRPNFTGQCENGRSQNSEKGFSDVFPAEIP